MKDFKDLRKRFYQPWIICVLVMILAASSLLIAGRYSPPGNEPLVSGQAVEALIKQGDNFFNQGQYDEAIAAFTRAIEWNSKNGVAFRKRGQAKFQMKDYEGALVDAGKAILLDPMDYLSYDLQAKGRFELRRYDESLEDCETAISINDKFADAYINRARIKQVKEDLDGALKDVKKALEIEPGSSAGRDLLKQIESGTAGGATEPDSTPPIRAIGEIKPPNLIKQVDPEYPEIARQARVEGIVIIEATTDSQGNVINTHVLRSIPLLDDAALAAVKQWIYEPYIIEGKKRGVIFTVTVRFNLK